MDLLWLLWACRPDPVVEESDTDTSAPDTDPVPVFDPSSAIATIEVAETEVATDASTALSVTVFDAQGIAIPDGATIEVTTSRGTVQLGSTVGGRADGAFVAGNVPGPAALGTAFATHGDREIAVVAGPAHSVQLHMHGPISEGLGSHGFQVEQARTYGVDVLWWSDHDWAYALTYALTDSGIDAGTVVFSEPTDDARSGLLTVPGAADVALALALEADGTYAVDASLDASDCAVGEWCEARVAWKANRTGIRRALLGDVHLLAEVYVPDADSAVRVRVALSRAGDVTTDPITLVFRDPADAVSLGATEVAVDLDLDVGWNVVDLDVSGAASDALGSLDHGVSGVTFELARNGPGTGTFGLDAIRLEQVVCCDALRDRQADWLDTNSPPPPVQHVGVELSIGVPHLNVFGDVPLATFDGLTTDPDAAEMVALARAEGAAVSLNHVFGATEESVTGEPAEVCHGLDLAGVYGVDVIEVGYPDRVRPLESHLQVWDCLAGRGYTLTGIGTSDSHDNDPWADRPNRYTTWVYAPTPAVDDLAGALTAGRAFFGDPIWFEGADVTLDLSANRGHAAMGQVVAPSPTADSVLVTASPLQPGMTVRLVVDGVLFATTEVTAVDFAQAYDVEPRGGDLVVRAEVWSETREPLLFSNPVTYRADATGIDAARVPRP